MRSSTNGVASPSARARWDCGGSTARRSTVQVGCESSHMYDLSTTVHVVQSRVSFGPGGAAQNHIFIIYSIYIL